MQTPTSGSPPLDDVEPLLDQPDELDPLQPDDVVEPLQPDVVEPLLLDQPLLDVVEPQPLLEVVEPTPLDDDELQPDDVEPLLDEEEDSPQSPHGTPLMPTSPPFTRAAQTRPGLHLFFALHSWPSSTRPL